jgi:hypothetical protein
MDSGRLGKCDGGSLRYKRRSSQAMIYDNLKAAASLILFFV